MELVAKCPECGQKDGWVGITVPDMPMEDQKVNTTFTCGDCTGIWYATELDLVLRT